jgi:hypothetical protein
VAKVYSGDQGSDYIQQQNAEQPVQVDLGIIEAGADPVQLAGDLAHQLVGDTP